MTKGDQMHYQPQGNGPNWAKIVAWGLLLGTSIALWIIFCKATGFI